MPQQVLDCTTFDSSPCDTKKEEDCQQTETTIVPATCTKNLVTNIANPTKRQRLEEQPHARVAPRGRASTQYLNGMEGLQ